MFLPEDHSRAGDMFVFKVIRHVLAGGTFQNWRHVCVAFTVFVLQIAEHCDVRMSFLRCQY